MTDWKETRGSSRTRLGVAAALAVGLQFAAAFGLPKSSREQPHAPLPDVIAVELVAPPAPPRPRAQAAEPAMEEVETPQKTPAAAPPKTATEVAKPSPRTRPPQRAAPQRAAPREPPAPPLSRNAPVTPAAEIAPPVTPHAPSVSAAAVQRAASALVEAKPDYLSNPPPDYPAEARRQGWTGTVLLSVQVGPDGTARDVRLARSSGHDVLDRAARNAVFNWRFDPATRNGRPVGSRVEVPIRFEFAS